MVSWRHCGAGDVTRGLLVSCRPPVVSALTVVSGRQPSSEDGHEPVNCALSRSARLNRKGRPWRIVKKKTVKCQMVLITEEKLVIPKRKGSRND